MQKWKSQQQAESHLTNHDKIKELHSDSVSIPPDVITWLARLKLLHGVPFNYLVPDEQMLPPESIRFFQLDPNWLDALLEGAFSLGSTTAGDHAHDKAYIDQAHQDAHQELKQIRHKALHQQADEGVRIEQASTISGFILRSTVVADWPGLEVDAYPPEADTNNPQQKLKIVRMERLSPHILLCLFDGLIHDVFIHEPTEGLHFGIDKDEHLQHYKQLWDIKPDVQNPNIKTRDIAEDDQNKKIQPLPMRTKNKNVLNISQMVEDMKTQLNTDSADFTAAEFALQMVEGVESVHFNNK